MICTSFLYPQFDMELFVTYCFSAKYCYGYYTDGYVSSFIEDLLVLNSAKGRNWFGLFAGVRKSSLCAQTAISSSALVRCKLLLIVGFAVSFAV